MKAWIKTGVSIALWALVAGHAVAADFRVGVVDTERILRESAPAVAASKKIEQEFAARSDEIRKLSDQVKNAQAALDKNGATLPDADRRARERDLDSMTNKLQQMQREFREDLNLRKNEELVNVLALATKVIQKIAESGNYDLILQEAVYRNPKLDITDQVIKYLEDNRSPSSR